MTKPNEMVLNDKALEAAARGIFDTWATANNCDMSWEEAVTASCDVNQYPKMSAIVPLCRNEAKAAITAYTESLLADMPERAETVEKLQRIQGYLMHGTPITTELLRDASDQAAALLSLPDQGGEVTVKPLEWVDDRMFADSERYTADSALGPYEVLKWASSGFGGSVPGGGEFESLASIDDAKAAAQSDYETRIRAALTNGGEGNDLV